LEGTTDTTNDFHVFFFTFRPGGKKIANRNQTVFTSFILEMCTKGARRESTHDRHQRALRTESTSRSPPPWCTCVGVWACVSVRVCVCVRAPVNVYKQNGTAPQSIEQGRSTRTPSTWKRYAPRPHLNGNVDRRRHTGRYSRCSQNLSSQYLTFSVLWTLISCWVKWALRFLFLTTADY